MTAFKTFEALAAYLLQKIGLPEAVLKKGSKSYSITIDGQLQVHLIGAQEGFFTLWSLVGKVPENAERAMLMTLLYANQFNFDYPPVCLGVERETNDISIWVKQKLTEMDEESTHCLFKRFVKMVALVQQWLEVGGTPGNEKKKDATGRVKSPPMPL